MPAKRRLSVYLDPKLLADLTALAKRRGTSLSLVAEASIASFLSPDGSDRLEAAITRRLDRMSRQAERHERDLGIATEMLALFIRHWLTASTPLPDTAQAAAQAKGRERYAAFLSAVAKRVGQETSTAREVLEERVAT